jgi:uncharacterized membrane protein YeaQ/YmgE (transglycosylase-associated protein family)
MANAVVSQSGGPTGVINASLVGVIGGHRRGKIHRSASAFRQNAGNRFFFALIGAGFQP